jgi:hypothetical protein
VPTAVAARKMLFTDSTPYVAVNTLCRLEQKPAINTFPQKYKCWPSKTATVCMFITIQVFIFELNSILCS